MKPSTIFSAYKRIEAYKNSLSMNRGTNFGIAVQNDSKAIAWQKANRKSKIFENWLEKFFEEF